MHGQTEGDRAAMAGSHFRIDGTVTGRLPAPAGIPALEPGPSGQLMPSADSLGVELCDPDRVPWGPERGEDGRAWLLRFYAEGIHLEASPHYRGEFTLHFDDAGNGSMRVNLDVGDLAALRGALPGRAEATPAEVRAFLIGLIARWDPDPAKPLDDMAARSVDAIRRVISMLGEG
jgi:hypothetical protein